MKYYCHGSRLLRIRKFICLQMHLNTKRWKSTEMRAKLRNSALLLPICLALLACGERQPAESSDEFAARLKGTAIKPVNKAELPTVAENGKTAIQTSVPYSQKAPDGSVSGLQFKTDGTFQLNEDGKTISGTYTWLPDGKRLRLNGVEKRPIVLIANGALYRMTNEDVPLDDITPDRMMVTGAPEAPKPKGP